MLGEFVNSNKKKQNISPKILEMSGTSKIIDIELFNKSNNNQNIN